MSKAPDRRKAAGAVSLKPRRPRKVVINLTITLALLNSLHEYVNASGASRSEVITLAITEYLASRVDPSSGLPLPPLVL